MGNYNSFGILFYLRKEKKNKKGLAPIFVRITYNGKRAESSINRKVDPTRWDKNAGYVSGTKEDARSINSHIDSLRNRIHDIKRDMLDHNEFITATILRNRLNGIDQRQKTILEIFRLHNKNMKELEGKTFALATVKKYETTYKHLKEFLIQEYKVDDLYLTQLNFELITSFEKYLKITRNCNHNSTIKYIKNFKKIVHQALENDWLDKDPFLKYKSKFEESTIEFLSEAELFEIENKEITIPRLDIVRDIFVFSCYTGYAYVDVEKLTADHIVFGIDGEKWIYTFREKTRVKSNVPLLPKALEIIEKYKDHPEAIFKNRLFPVPSNQKINAYLKEIATICGIKKTLTFHIARHTYATTILLTNGVPIETASNLMGHKSIRSTQGYAKVVEKKVSEDMAPLRNKFNINSHKIISNGTTNN